MKPRFVWSIALLVLGLTACTDSPEWTLLYYPDAASKSSVEQSAAFISGYYSSIEQCLAKGAGMQRLSGSKTAEYVCGHLCVADAKKLVCSNMVMPEPVL
ncbi:hypothetical protein [Shewanella youngdeokensis]|uniref:Lipoprotein n=1 Tax=Shewanella youngdeokensis TaxID=2999068 RepID=A0ABZ0JXM6_9GAMM|nr:hypothetical protein RGE70_17380 [Shewanella sp. DAU334]